MVNRKKEGSGIPYYLSTFAQDNNNIKMTANYGYVIAPQKIIRCFRLNDIEKVLLLEVVSYMGENDYAFPSHKRLAFKLGKKSTASIKNGLKSLKEKGFIYWSKGGGDLGTNNYRLCDLSSNPYLIMSEFTHFFVEEILDVHRGEISYEDIYSTVLEIVEKPKKMCGIDDPYGICIDFLFRDIKLRDRIDMYWVFGDILRYNISRQSKITIKCDAFDIVNEHFEKYHPSIEIEYEEDHPILDVLKNPYWEQSFEVKVEGISNNQEDEHLIYYNKIIDELNILDEREIYKLLIEVVIMSCPSAFLMEPDLFDEFMSLEDMDSKIDLVKDMFTVPMAKSFTSSYLFELKLEELGNQPSGI